MSPRSIQALRAGVKALTTNPRKALEVLRLATEDDPGMADAWLARMAAGDWSVGTVCKLAETSDRLGSDLRISGAGVTLGQLDVTFSVEYVTWAISDVTTARLAYVSLLLTDRKFDEASRVLAGLRTDPRVQFTRAVLMQMTERWPDVLTALAGREAWTHDDVLSRSSALLEAKAAAHLGKFDRASAAVDAATDSPFPLNTAVHEDPVARDGTYLRAMIARAQGDEDTARTILGDVLLRWPDYELARTALADPTFGISVVDQATIETRDDPWDPATGRTPQQRQDDKDAADARAQLAEAQATLDRMVGLDDVKNQVRMLKANTLARIVRERKNLRNPVISNHLLMTGPPGVGKTETSKAIAKTLCGLGVLPTSKVEETSKEKLAGPHVGDVEFQTSTMLEKALGGVVLFDEFHELLHGGFAGGDPIGQAIIGAIVPWMENNRDKAVLIAAGYPAAVQKVIDYNRGFQGRFSTTIRFETYPPDVLLEITASIIKHGDSTVHPGALARVLMEPFTKLYNKITITEDGDTIRGIDELNNGRFARNIVERAITIRNLRMMDSFGLDAVDMADPDIGSDIPDDAVTLITEDDLADGLYATLPAEYKNFI
ncbi:MULTISPECIES: AAA family ATPase [Mycolicibacterium]|uniref:AAA family ATPase n=1 Tax=Mycolicibacterium TaxID=1866885 RepID=UPI0005C7750E|nr:AAA family ATPase [Mycolicibacterium aubagnense]WGI35766.1 AAA family ATPase [Mycolicibacterium aubagnense]